MLILYLSHYMNSLENLITASGDKSRGEPLTPARLDPHAPRAAVDGPQAPVCAQKSDQPCCELQKNETSKSTTRKKNSQPLFLRVCLPL